MPDPRHFQLLARYNAWMNEKLLDSAATLPAEALRADRGAFFGSVLGTLNHLVVADTLWCKRFASYPPKAAALAPIVAMPDENRLDAIPCATLDALRARRATMDAAIQAWTAELDADDLAHVLAYRNRLGIASRRELASVLLHFFNHQTHHRAQAATLLTQAGADVGATDLLLLVPDELPGQ